MKIAIEARVLQGPGSGIRRYVAELCKALPEANATHHYAIETDGPMTSWLLPWWLEYTVPNRLKRHQPAVVHFTKADVPRRKIAPTVVTVYDVIPLLLPASQRLLQRRYWPKALARAATYSDAIITISEQSKRDIVQHLRVPAEKVIVTPLAIEATDFAPANEAAVRAVGEHFQLTRPYILFVGTLEPKKNVPALIRCFAQVAREREYDLVIVGRQEHDVPNIKREIARLALEGRVHLLDYVADEHLPGLYSGADLFVYPSIYEGWGFPVQEAMACGTPVIVSNGGSLPEVVGAAGVVVPFRVATIPERLHDPVFEEELTRTMVELLGDVTKRNQLRDAGLQYVGQRSWRAVAAETIAVYERVAQ